MKKLIDFYFTLGVCFLLVTSTILLARNEYFDSPPNYGSVHNIVGTTVICTVFVDTPGYKWDWNNRKDATLFYDIRDKIGIAAKYLEDNVARYGKECHFIYDIEIEPIWYHISSTNIVETSNEDDPNKLSDVLSGYKSDIKTFFDGANSDSVKKGYNADNIFYYFIFKKDGRSFCFPCYDPAEKKQEYCMMFAWNGKYRAQTFAHEFLHSCGAIDLYRDKGYGIPAVYDKYLEDNNSHDIMREGTYETNKIYAEFSELDAYYCGLTEEPEEVKKYNLDKGGYYRPN